MPEKTTTPRATVPFADFERRMKILCTEMNCYPSKAMILLGYGDSSMSHWKGKGKVPLIAMNALTGVLSELKNPPVEPTIIAVPTPAVPPFTPSQLLAIFTLTIGEPISTEDMAELRRIVLFELRRVAK